MGLRSLRHTQWLVPVAACAAIACSGNKSPTPDVWVTATVGQTAAGGTCNEQSATTIISVGPQSPSPLDKPTTVSSGGADVGGTVNITCSINPSGSGFDVQLSVVKSGQGSLTITSAPGKGAVTETGGTVTVTWSNPMVGQYDQSDCMFTATFQGGSLPSGAGPAVAGGRIWGHVSCPAAQNQNQTLMNGMFVTCDGEADFLFENCSGS
jgi:hypothetical protein